MNDFLFESAAHVPEDLIDQHDGDENAAIVAESRTSLERGSQEMLQALRDEYEVWDEAHSATQEIRRICVEGKTGRGLFSDPQIAQHVEMSVLVSDELNAFVFFGADTAYLVISTSLINALESEDALAAVLAHEIGHVELASTKQKKHTNHSTSYIFETRGKLPIRAEEIQSDSVARRLDQAGYYSRASKEVANVLLRDMRDQRAKNKRGAISDASHGDLYDRQQVDNTIHLLEDYPSSECEPTALDSVFQELPTAACRFRQIFQCVEKMFKESVPQAVASQEIAILMENMSLDGVIHTFQHAIMLCSHRDWSTVRLSVVEQVEVLQVKITLLAILQPIVELRVQQECNCSEDESLLLLLLLSASSFRDTLSDIQNISDWVEMYKKDDDKKIPAKDALLVKDKIADLETTLQSVTVYNKIIALRLQHSTWLSFLQAVRQATQKVPDFLVHKTHLFRALHLSFCSTYEYETKLLYLVDLKPILQCIDLLDNESWQTEFVDAVFNYFEDCRVFDAQIMGENLQYSIVYCLLQILQKELGNEAQRRYARDPVLKNELLQNRGQSRLLAQVTKCYTLVAKQIRERITTNDANEDLTLTSLQEISKSLQQTITLICDENSVSIDESVIVASTQSLISVHPMYSEAVQLVKDRLYSQAFDLINHDDQKVNNLFDFLELIEEYDEITLDSIRFVHDQLLALKEDELRSPAALNICERAGGYPSASFEKLVKKFGIEVLDENVYYDQDSTNVKLMELFSSLGAEDLRVLLELFLINRLIEKAGNAVAVEAVRTLMESMRQRELSGRLLFTCFSSIHVCLERTLGDKMLLNMYDSQNDELRVWYQNVLSHPLISQMREGMLSEFKTLNTSDQLHWLSFIQSVLSVARTRESVQLSSIRELPLGKQEFMRPFLEVVLSRVLEIDWDTATLGDLYDMHQFAPAFLNRREARNTQSVLEMRMARQLSLSQALRFVEQLIKQDIVNPDVLDYMQSQLVNTPCDLKEFEQFWEKNLTKLLEEKKDSIESVSYADMFIRAVEGSSSQTIFTLCVESHDNDSKLRESLVSVWFDWYCDPEYKPLASGFDVFFQKRQYIFKKIGKRTYGPVGKQPQLFVPFTEFMSDFYSQITDTQRVYILHRLLLAENGLLVSQEGRKTLIAFLREKLYKANDSGAMAVFANDLIEILLSVDKPDYELTIDPLTLVRPLTDLLAPFCLQPPDRAFRPRDNFKAARRLVKQYAPYVEVQTQIDTGSQHGMVRFDYRHSYDHIIPKLTPIEAMALLQAQRPEQLIDDPVELKIAQAQQLLLQLTGIDVTKKPNQTRTYSELEVLVTIAESKGILGARFLQLLETYISLPDNIRQRVLKAQDRVTRQLKLTAMRTLRREGAKENASQFMQYFWQNLVRIEDTPNGGSLMRLLKAHLTDGTIWAVKVLTPNAIDTIRTDVAEVREIITLLRKIPRYTKSQEIGLAEILVNDLERFILDDIECVEYEEKDRQYREMHAGRELSTSFGSVELAVPYMPETGSKYVKIEQWVDGETFVRWRESAPAEHVSAATQLIREDFTAQITTPIAATNKYVVHPDSYGGNFMISKVDSSKGEQSQLVVWQMDRGLYLEFSEQEIGFCKMLQAQSFTVQNVMQFVQCLLNEPENKRKKSRLLLKIAQLGPSALFSGGTDRGTGLLVTLRQKGLHVPLKWSLFMRGLIWLNQLS